MKIRINFEYSISDELRNFLTNSQPYFIIIPTMKKKLREKWCWRFAVDLYALSLLQRMHCTQRFLFHLLSNKNKSKCMKKSSRSQIKQSLFQKREAMYAWKVVHKSCACIIKKSYSQIHPRTQDKVHRWDVYGSEKPYCHMCIFNFRRAHGSTNCFNISMSDCHRLTMNMKLWYQKDAKFHRQLNRETT